MTALASSPGVQAGFSRGDGAPLSHCCRPVPALLLALAQSLPQKAVLQGAGCLGRFSYALWYC